MWHYLVGDPPLLDVRHELRAEAGRVRAPGRPRLVLVVLRGAAVNVVDLIQVMLHCPQHTHQKEHSH